MLLTLLTILNIQIAKITCYAPTGYNMANGMPPKEGYVAVSDRSIPFGTEIFLEGKTYIVGDRTAKWVHDKYGLTVDIFKEDCTRKFGTHKALIYIK